MKQFMFGLLFMLMVLKPQVGIALFGIFASGMQTAASAMAESNPIHIDPNTSFVPQNTVYAPLQPELTVEERVQKILEEREQHKQEQAENQKKEEIIEETIRGERVGVEMFDEEFNKKFKR